MFGDPKTVKLDVLKKVVQEMSGEKKIGGWEKPKVAFKDKAKKLDIKADGISFFMITGENLDIEKLAETLETMGISSQD